MTSQRIARERSLIRSEWIKFRTVRGWVVAIILAAALIVFAGLFLAGSVSIGCGPTRSGRACLPQVPIGPGGEAVTDSFYLVRRPLAGDGTITVRVGSFTGLHSDGVSRAVAGQSPLASMQKGLAPWAKGGIIIAAGTKPGSAYAAMMVTGSHGVRMQHNYTGDTAGLPGLVSAGSPRWLRLTRTGNTVSGYDSADGRSWQLVGRATLSLPATVQAGLFATSPVYNKALPFFGGMSIQGGPSQSTAVISDVSLDGDWPGARWTGDDIGDDGATSPGTGIGYYREARGVFTVSGSGDIAPAVIGPASAFPSTTIEQPLVGLFLGLIPMVVVATMFFTAEYRRRLIWTTLSASPGRGRLLAAKAIVIAATAFAATLVAAIIVVPLGASRSRGQGQYVLPVSTLTEVRVLVGAAAVVAVSAVLAVAVGAIVRRSAAAVATVVAIIVVPFLLSVAVLPSGAAAWVLRLTPAAGFALLQSIPNYPQVSNANAAGSGVYPLPPLAGFGVLCLYTAAALALAAVLLRRRDA